MTLTSSGGFRFPSASAVHKPGPITIRDDVNDSQIVLTDVELHAANASDHHHGLLGFVAFTVDGHLRVDGVTVRLTGEGHLSLSWPQRPTARGGHRRNIFPVDADAKRRIEDAILDVFGFRREVEA